LETQVPTPRDIVRGNVFYVLAVLLSTVPFLNIQGSVHPVI